MSQDTNNGESESGGLMSRVRTPILFLLGLFLVLGAYYFLYAQKKTNYLVGRNLRLLASMGNMVAEAITSYDDFVKNQAKPLEEVRGLTRTECQMDENEITAVRKSMADPLFRLRGTGLELAHVFSGAEPSCYRPDTAKFFSALFASKGAFDGVLLAKTTGEVVYQHQVPDLGITHLGVLLAQMGAGDSKKSAAEEASSFSSAASYRNVEIGGREYKLFIEPIRLPIGSSFAGGARETWLLCGVVAADKFVYESLAISSSLLLLILAPLLLAALAWPLIRLRLIGERQRIRVFDVLLLGICSLLGVAILTLSLLDVYAYAELTSVSEEQLRGFAADMAGQISKEITVAGGDLADLQKEANRRGYSADQGVSEAREVPPSWNRFALIDEKGQQKLRWGKRVSPLMKVDDREYFKRARKNDRLWTLPDSESADLGPFFLESVTSRTSHRREAVLAAPVIADLKERKYAVATLSIPMRSVINPIAPPGFEFAVIDGEGAVLFHSNSDRNGVENFFTETDDDRRLRSAVFARRSEEMSIRYFGNDYMAVVQPVGKLPLTVVAMRDAEQLQALNMEWVVTTVLFLLLCSSPFVVVLLASVITRPGYRAPWIWPDPGRAGDYMNLAALLAMYCLAFGVAIEHLSDAGRLLGIAWTLPFFALLTCYVRLEERATHSSIRRIAVYAAYGLLSLALLRTLFADRSRADAGAWITTAAVAILILSACFFSVRHPARWRRWAEKFHLPVARAYPLAALLLVVLTTVLPTLSIFKAVHRLELYSFIRHGQLKLARGLAEQDAAAREDNGDQIARQGDKEPDFGFYASSFFATRLKKEDACSCDNGTAAKPEEPLPDLLENLLPHYSVHSAEMRELLHEHASDCSWDAHRVLEDAMDLHLRGGPGSDVYVTSSFPGLFAGTAEKIVQASSFSNRSGTSALAGAVASLCLLLLFLSAIFRLVLFISQRLFLVDIREPLWTVAGDTLAPIAGRNLFLVRKSPISRVEADAMGLTYLHLGEIEQAGDPGGEAFAMRCREAVDSGSGVLVTGFEHRISDPAFNARKLALLESLMELRERSIIVLSQVSPARLFSYEPAGSPGIYDRWRTILCSFTLVEEHLRFRPAASRAPSGSFWGELLKPFFRWGGLVGATSKDFIISSPVLREESGRDPFLRKIAQGVDMGRHGMGREQLLEELGERAEGYYSAVWESCSRDEKVVLQHLAQEGLVNEKNRRVIRRLMARGLIRRAPNFCLLNESFRRFACSAHCRSQVLAFEQSAAPSAWDRFRWPFLAVLSASIAFFFATQQQLLDSTLAAVTGLTAGLPAVVKIIDLLGGKRSGASK